MNWRKIYLRNVKGVGQIKGQSIWEIEKNTKNKKKEDLHTESLRELNWGRMQQILVPGSFFGFDVRWDEEARRWNAKVANKDWNLKDIASRGPPLSSGYSYHFLIVLQAICAHLSPPTFYFILFYLLLYPTISIRALLAISNCTLKLSLSLSLNYTI